MDSFLNFTVGLTSLSPGQTVLLDTSVPPPSASTVAHFQPSCTEQQTITLGNLTPGSFINLYRAPLS